MNTIDQLKRDEGWKHSVYQDALGYLTIGCGFMVDARHAWHLAFFNSAIPARIKAHVSAVGL